MTAEEGIRELSTKILELAIEEGRNNKTVDGRLALEVIRRALALASKLAKELHPRNFRIDN